MKKVLFLVNDDNGLYKFRKELVETLLEKGYQVTISSPFGTRIHHFLEKGSIFRECPINRRGRNPFEDFKLLCHYWKLLKKIKPDVVLTYTIKPNIYGGIACRFQQIPYAANITGLGTALENEGWLQKITVQLYKIAFKKINYIFFQNEENKVFFNKKIPISGQQVLLPGSGVNLLNHSLLDFPNNSTNEFIFIGRLMKEKGINEYLEAAKVIKERYPNTKFHICGSFEENYGEIISSLQEKGIVEYHGEVDNIQDYLKRVHCTIHPSFYPEGMSNVLLESSASGRPIITVNRSGCREIVDEGKNGYFVRPKDSKDLINTIEKFINLNEGEKKNMGLYGRVKVEKSFSREIVVKKYLEAIEST